MAPSSEGYAWYRCPSNYSSPSDCVVIVGGRDTRPFSVTLSSAPDARATWSHGAFSDFLGPDRAYLSAPVFTVNPPATIIGVRP